MHAHSTGLLRDDMICIAGQLLRRAMPETCQAKVTTAALQNCYYTTPESTAADAVPRLQNCIQQIFIDSEVLCTMYHHIHHLSCHA
jgi:hypothetical protein